MTSTAIHLSILGDGALGAPLTQPFKARGPHGGPDTGGREGGDAVRPVRPVGPRGQQNRLTSLWFRERPERSVVGTVILVLSVVVMPTLARAKRRVARALGSAALEADATQTSLCAYLSAIALGGVALNAVMGWWWCDPAAALIMVPIIAREGVEDIRGEAHCDDCR